MSEASTLKRKFPVRGKRYIEYREKSLVVHSRIAKVEEIIKRPFPSMNYTKLGYISIFIVHIGEIKYYFVF